MTETVSVGGQLYPTTNAETVLYTCPLGMSVKVNLSASNETAGIVTGSIYIIKATESSATKNTIAISVQANDTKFITDVLVLGGGDKISIKSASGSTIAWQAFVCIID